MKHLVLLLFVILGFGTIQAQEGADCDKIKKGFFTYDDDGQTMYLYRTSNAQTEWSEDGVVYMDGKVEWKSSCSYSFVLGNLRILKYDAGYSKEEAKLFEQTMEDILKDAVFEAEVNNPHSNGYTASINVLGEIDNFELKRISKKKGKKKLKLIKKALKKAK